MTESFHKSFNEEFCIELELALCSVFSNCDGGELSLYWCDGVSWTPFYNLEVNKDYLSYENVKTRLYIETNAWLGVEGQDRYEMKIKLGDKSLKKYQNNESLITCIPSIENDEWIEIDTENNKIQIYLL